MKNPLLSERKTGTTGRLVEKKFAKSTGARLTPASGAMAHSKGDAKLGEFLVELKSTVSASLILNFEWLKKIKGEALMKGKIPALSVNFSNPDGSRQRDGAWIMIEESVFKEILEKLNELH